jgi:hypothetical protein
VVMLQGEDHRTARVLQSQPNICAFIATLRQVVHLSVVPSPEPSVKGFDSRGLLAHRRHPHMLETQQRGLSVNELSHRGRHLPSIVPGRLNLAP